MGKFSKKPRKEESDSDSLDERQTEETLTLENKYDDDDDDNEYDNDNEEEEDSKEEVYGMEQNDNGKDAEMEELDRELTDLRRQEQDLMRNLKHHKDEDLLKGQAVKNQKEPLKSSFCDSDSRVHEAYSDLITSSKSTLDSILELQEALIEKNPSIAQAIDGNTGQPLKSSGAMSSSNGEGDEEWSQISEMHSRISSFRNKSIDKWQRKTQMTAGAAAIKGKLHAFNQDISEQVAAYMRDPSRMINGMQQSRSTVAIFGTVPGAEGSTKEQDTKVDGEPELLDDSEFYQQLLKEFFETFDPTSTETALYALKRMQTKKRKIVDRRASKSRKIRYHVHEKIVNFMAPQPMQLHPMAPKLFENLFGLKTQKSVPLE
ncbi:hypothetical protein U1Q18_022936 [Sarracenia purpurea var. burkii]